MHVFIYKQRSEFYKWKNRVLTPTPTAAAVKKRVVDFYTRELQVEFEKIWLDNFVSARS